jgi:Synergist-CTERM protein sorting domain-containing protein
LTLTGAGELELAGRGSSTLTGPAIPASLALGIGQGTVKISNALAVDNGPISLNTASLLHVENGLTLNNDIFIPAGTGGSVIGTTVKAANKNSDTPAFATTRTFNAQGNAPFEFAVQLEAGTTIEAGESIYVMQVTRGITGVNVTTPTTPATVTVVDFAGNPLPFTPHITQDPADQKLFFTADEDIDAPDITAESSSAVSGKAFTITLAVSALSDIDGKTLAVTGLDDLIAAPATDVAFDAATSKITIKGTAPTVTKETKVPYKVSISTTTGIAVEKDFELTVTTEEETISGPKLSVTLTSTEDSITAVATYLVDDVAAVGKELVFSIKTGTEEAVDSDPMPVEAEDGKVEYVFKNLTPETEYTVEAFDAADTTVIASGTISTKAAGDTPGSDEPVTATDGLAEVESVAPVKSGASISIPGEIDPAKYDVDTLKVVASGTNWEISWTEISAASLSALSKADGKFHIVGTMPASSVTYHLTAKAIGDATTTYKSASHTVSVESSTEEPGKKSSSGGCDAGFAGLGLLLAASLFLRKKG